MCVAMYVIVVGAGEVGSYLARILADEQHDVAVIDASEQVARDLEASLDALVVHGSGVSRQSLRRAGIARADLVLAVTHVDEVNLMVCMAAAKHGKSPLTVARVRESAFLTGDSPLTAQELGISMLVGPEQAVANQVDKLLSYEGSGESHMLAGGRVALLELPLSADSPLAHDSLADLRDTFPTPSLVAAVRGPRGIRIPHGDDHMRPDERAYILSLPENVDEFWILSGKPWHHVRHVLIIGCGNVGIHLAAQLEAKKLYPTIVELDAARAAWVSKNVTKSIVLCADGADPDFLREQMQERADAVVVLIGDDEKAVLAALLAKHLGAKKVVARCDKLAYAPISDRLGIDALISPRRAVADEILRFVRHGKISSARMLGDHEAEILDFSVPHSPRNSDVIEKPLRELELPRDALIGVVMRGDDVTIATGDTVLQAGDELLIAALPAAMQKVMDLFAE